MPRDYTSVQKCLEEAGIELCPPEYAATDAQVTAAEARLGVSLPPSFVWFLKTYGSDELFGNEVYSFYGTVVDGRYEVDADEHVGDLVRNRELERADGFLDDALLPCMATDFGETFCLDSSRPAADGEYPVVVVRGRDREDYAPDFAAFVERFLAG